MLSLLKSIFGTQQTRIIARYSRLVQKINNYEKTLHPLTDDELREKAVLLKQEYNESSNIEDILISSFAIVKNTCSRLCGSSIDVMGFTQEWNMIPYDEQILGGLAMHYGNIAEMQTGEGKTLTAALPLFTRALTGNAVHIITVNDYLAQRDAAFTGEIFRFHNMKVGSLTNSTPLHERKALYNSDVLYGAGSEFGFDYLRDNSLALSIEEQVQRGHYFALIDEIDSILIDEARTPLIMSAAKEVSTQNYDVYKAAVRSLVDKQKSAVNTRAKDAIAVLKKLNQLDESPKSLSKAEKKERDEALRSLWVVSKGAPRHAALRTIREYPELRHSLESIETLLHSDVAKEQRIKLLEDLLIILEEKNNDFELTEKGTQEWSRLPFDCTSDDDFTMIDLGHEYALIDAQKISEKEKIEQKTALRDKDNHKKDSSHIISKLFRAHLLMEKNVDYIIENGLIVIIDENTGRPQHGRQFSDGLHQAIEAKENLTIQKETQTNATITLQNYFRMYENLSGMTGTAVTEAQEFKHTYNLDVIIIPTHKKCVRKDLDDQLYVTEREKFKAILNEIKKVNREGRPILIGTDSVETSEKVSKMLSKNMLEHKVLNAKNHEKEAEIVSEAGQRGSITVATNMAGRGTDIQLGDGIAELGGLHVLGAVRNKSRRIDRQLRGRCARQGDPGSSVFYLSFEDPLMRQFVESNRIGQYLLKNRPKEDEVIASSMISKSIEVGQKRGEQRLYTMRKNTLDYDNVMNEHRKEAYAFRDQVLKSDDMMLFATNLIKRTVSNLIEDATQDGVIDISKMITLISEHIPCTLDAEYLAKDISNNDVYQHVEEKAINTLLQKLEIQAQVINALQKANNQESSPLAVLDDILRNIFIRGIDSKWRNHLLHMDHLRTEVALQAIAQKDPLQEYKHAAFHLFTEFTSHVRYTILNNIFRFEMVIPKAPEVQQKIQNNLKKSKKRFIDMGNK